jgi:uncharacterized protein with HEPN domain
MLLNNEDKGFLWDIIDACNDIEKFMENTSFYEFENDKMKRFAVERQLLVIGEAANHLSNGFIDENKTIPWKSIIGLRNIIAHDYGDVLIDRIWKIAKDSVPELNKNLRTFL